MTKRHTSPLTVTLVAVTLIVASWIPVMGLITDHHMRQQIETHRVERAANDAASRAALIDHLYHAR